LSFIVYSKKKTNKLFLYSEENVLVWYLHWIHWAQHGHIFKLDIYYLYYCRRVSRKYFTLLLRYV